MNRFNVETAIEYWRHWLRLNRSFNKDDLDELENHLRDHVEEQIDNGIEPEKAFRTAAKRLGTYIEFEAEYDKVRFGPKKRRSSLKSEFFWRVALYRSYLRAALRQTIRYRGYTLLNVGGLAVGIASCAIIMLFVRDEVSYDRFHEDAEQIYVLTADYYFTEDLHVRLGGVPVAFGPTLEHEVAAVEHTMRWERTSSTFTDQRGLNQKETIYRADPSFFEIFSFPLLSGSQETALSEPNSLLLTPDMALVYFGREDPIGQTLTDENGLDYVISGIIAEPPHNTGFDFDFIGPYEKLDEASQLQAGGGAWAATAVVKTYVKLARGNAVESLEASYLVLLDKYMPNKAETYSVVSDRLVDLHLSGSVRNRTVEGLYGDMHHVWLFSGIALLILLIACINYTNLATARALRRSREVGVLRAVGADRRELIQQFLSESLLLTFVAAVFALILTVLGFPAFNELVGKPVTLTIEDGVVLVTFAAALAFVVGLLAGSYPAFFLSRVRVVMALKGQGNQGERKTRLRSSLVTFQFAISVGLIISTIVMLRQLNFMLSKDLGLQADQVISVSIPPDGQDRFTTIRDAFLQIPDVLDVAGAAS